MDMSTHVVTRGTAPLSLSVWFAQLLITFMFASGFISYYRRFWQFAFLKLKDKPAMQWVMRIGMMVAAIGIGTGLHMVGWLVFTNASGLMFHNMGLFVLTFILLDQNINLGEYGIRVLGILDVWLMHHMGYYDRPQFTISLIGLVIGVVILWVWRDQIRYHVARHIVAYLYLGVCFWALLPPHSAGLVITPMIIAQGLSMYLVMVVVTAFTLAHDHQVDLQNAANAQMAQYDSLTNAKSASIYRRDVTHFFQQARDKGQHLTVAAIDIDHFKQINDHYGHLAGDEVLIGVARTIADELQRHVGQHSLYRTGGEEFNIVFINATLDAVQEIVLAVWKTVQAQQFIAGNYAIKTTLSIGVAELKAGDQRFDDVFARADASLYQSKHNGRNAITIGDHTLNSNVQHHVMATRTLISQNVIDADNNQAVVAQEVLVARYEYDHDRWNFPTEFVLPIDVQLNYIKQLLAAGESQQVMLHLTPLQFENAETPTRLAAFIEQQPVSPNLVVEVDHKIDAQLLRQQAPRYHKRGMSIALNNLDTSLSPEALAPYLEVVDLLKVSCASLQKRYPHGILDQEEAQWHKHARQYGLIVTGIENSVDADFAIKVMHAQYLQGYYFDRPELPRLA